jgi:hypothetical protein
MKGNYSKQLITPTVKKIEDADTAFKVLYGHVQSLTDTLNQVLTGGLSLQPTESNLPLNLVRVRVTSGVPKAFPGYGASIVFVSDNAIVEKYSYRLIAEKSLEITVLFDDDKSHDVVLLIVNERLPA